MTVSPSPVFARQLRLPIVAIARSRISEGTVVSLWAISCGTFGVITPCKALWNRYKTGEEHDHARGREASQLHGAVNSTLMLACMCPLKP